MLRYIRRLIAADKLLREIVQEAEKCEGYQAHQLLPHIWPQICQAFEMYRK